MLLAAESVLVEARSKQSSKKGPTLALPVTRLAWSYGLWHFSCNRQLTPLEGKLSIISDGGIDSR
jgi:hypothetical protein